MSGSPSDRFRVDPIPLSKIRFDRRTWPRQHLDEERVGLFASLYQERGPDALPPIEAVEAGKLLLLSDGVTRRHAAKAAGITELPTCLVPVPEGEDPITFAFLRAVRASTGGHKELTRAERQAGVRRLISETALKDEEIAGLFGVARVTVWRHRQQATGSSNEHPGADAGETYLAQATAHDVATRLFRGLFKVYEARGLGVWDALTGDHTGERLAQVLTDAYGDKAVARAEQFRSWIDDAIASLSKEGRR